MVLNLATGHVSPQLHVVFDDEFYTVPFMREVTIPPNCKDLVQSSLQSGATKNIDISDTWFTTDLKEDSSETLSHNPSVAPENNNKTLALSQSEPHAQESTASKGSSVSELI